MIYWTLDYISTKALRDYESSLERIINPISMDTIYSLTHPAGNATVPAAETNLEG
jgi:hypothetical protein